MEVQVLSSASPDPAKLRTHLPRFHRHTKQRADLAELTRILLETGEAAPEPLRRVTLAGDERRLRGLPCHELAASLS